MNTNRPHPELMADQLWAEAAARRIEAALAIVATRPPRLMRHARAATSSRRWHWAWRKLHTMAHMHKGVEGWPVNPDRLIDVGYCLDRYTVDNPQEEPQ